MINGSYEDLTNYEGGRGNVRSFLYRWKWILAGILLLSFGVPFLIAHISITADDIGNDGGVSFFAPALLMSPPQSHTSSIPSTSIASNGKGKGRSPKVKGSGTESTFHTVYKANGMSTTTSMANFTDFAGLSCMGNGSALTSISLSNFYLDAKQFSLSVKNCLSVEEISLENIWLVGNFTRIALPNLRRFLYVQNSGDTRDSYKSPEALQQTLFFDKDPSQEDTGSSTWSVTQDLLNLGVDITVSKGGTKLIDIRRQAGEIYLNVKYCEDVLVNVKGSYDSLTLINCNVTVSSLPAIPGTLKYLNIRNSVQRTPLLADLIRKQTALEELYLWLTFHCDWPGYELYLNINDLPLTMKRLGMNNVDTTFIYPATPTSSIKELTIGDYTTNTTISQALPNLFSGLERINIVNVSDPSPAAGYTIIYQAIQMKVKEIAVVNLHRNYSAAIGNQEEILEVESLLDHAGIPKSPVSSFLLQLNAPNTDITSGLPGSKRNSKLLYVGKQLSDQERHQVRYKGLGFDKMDSFEDYLKWDSLQ